MGNITYDLNDYAELKRDLNALRDIIFTFADSAEHGTVISSDSLNHIAMFCGDCGEKLTALFGGNT